MKAMHQGDRKEKRCLSSLPCLETAMLDLEYYAWVFPFCLSSFLVCSVGISPWLAHLSRFGAEKT